MRVLFVSKPIAAPFHDGTKCLVRDLALHFTGTEVLAVGTRDTASFVEPSHPRARSVAIAPVHRSRGAFAPGFSESARTARFLAFEARADLWHFVYAPNARTGAVGRTLSALRGVPTLQTVASAPRSFASVERLLFADQVVAQSEHTAARIREAWDAERVPERRRPALAVVPPLVAAIAPRALEVRAALRRAHAIPEDAPLYVYPGDLETSSGASTVADAVAPLLAARPDAWVVFAYREKTPRARIVAAELRQRFAGAPVRVLSELTDVLALIEDARALWFPVDDLHGKVDLPIVLLEAMSLGVPVIALDRGPLRELGGVIAVEPGAEALVRASLRLDQETGLAEATIAAQRRAVAERYAAPVVARAYEALYGELLRARRR